MTTAYCEVCDWSRETGDELSRTDLNRAMIDHHVETGHAPIETLGGGEREPAEGVEWTPVEIDP